MNLFKDIRNFIDNDSFKIIIYDNLIDIINYTEIIDINRDNIKIITNKKVNIIGNDLNIIKLLDNEILIKGLIKDIKFDE